MGITETRAIYLYLSPSETIMAEHSNNWFLRITFLFFMCPLIINRYGVAGAVLQSTLLQQCLDV